VALVIFLKRPTAWSSGVGVLARATRWEEKGGGGLVGSIGPEPTEVGGSTPKPVGAGGAWTVEVEGKTGCQHVDPRATVPHGLTVQVIQTEIQIILNKFKTIQTSFDPKRTFSNSKNLK
jgi:hypothetical protein